MSNDSHAGNSEPVDPEPVDPEPVDPETVDPDPVDPETGNPATGNPATGSAKTYDPLYVQGIKYFNDCDFFEAHETWEALWTEYRGEARKYYQGLIQVAVALHHFGNGNIRGARKVYLTSRGYLQEYPPAYEGLDLETFLYQYDQCFAEVLSSEEEYPKIDIDPELIPEIHLINPH